MPAVTVRRDAATPARTARTTAAQAWANIPVGSAATVRRAKDGSVHTMIRQFAPKGVIRIVSVNDFGFVANSATDKNFDRYMPITKLGKVTGLDLTVSGN